MMDEPMTQLPMTGGCQCGAIRYQVRSTPEATYICHCRMCQKSVGGPFAGYAMVAAATFMWTRGSPDEWASSSLGLRQFCATCGSPLGYRYVDGPERAKQYLTTGSFDDFQTVVPLEQTGTESRARWMDHLAEIPVRDLGATMSPGQLDKLVNYQHPDHDTGSGWTSPVGANARK